jgi:hypothetical protein
VSQPDHGGDRVRAIQCGTRLTHPCSRSLALASNSYRGPAPHG